MISSRRAALLAAAAVLAAGCGTAPRAPHPATTAPSAPVATANPVRLLRLAGAGVPAGVSAGLVDIYGDRYATGTYRGGEQIVADTYATAAAERADVARNGTPQDGHALIQGDLFDIEVLAVQGASGGYAWSVSPARIAARVGGSLVAP